MQHTLTRPKKRAKKCVNMQALQMCKWALNMLPPPPHQKLENKTPDSGSGYHGSLGTVTDQIL